MTLVRVPASTSNLGAGFDCLGLALDIWLEARLLEDSGGPVYRGTLSSLDPEADIVMRLLRGTFPPGRRLELRSDIPVSRGLGSSAAAAVAGLALRELIAGRVPASQLLYREGAEREGHPDNVGPAVYGGLVLAGERPVRLAVSDRLAIALAVPEAPVDTRQARAILPNQVPRSVAVDQTRRAAALVQGLVTGDSDLVAAGMVDLIAVPHRKHLIPGYEAAVAAGREAGAFGVTISGSGSSLVGVAPRGEAPAVAAAMAEALTRAGNPARGLNPGVAHTGLSAA